MKIRKNIRSKFDNYVVRCDRVSSATAREITGLLPYVASDFALSQEMDSILLLKRSNVRTRRR